VDLDLGRRGLAGEVEGGRAAVVGGGHRADAVLHVDAGGLELGLEQRDEGVEVALGDAGILVDQQVVAEAVDGEAGEAVGLGVDQAHRALSQQRRAALAHRVTQALLHLRLVPHEVGLEAEHAHADRPLGLDQAPADAVAVLVQHRDHGALGQGVEVAAHGVAKHPRVAGADQTGDVQRHLDAGATHGGAARAAAGGAAADRTLGVGRALAGVDAAVARRRRPVAVGRPPVATGGGSGARGGSVAVGHRRAEHRRERGGGDWFCRASFLAWAPVRLGGCEPGLYPDAPMAPRPVVSRPEVARRRATTHDPW
jgi:hypothetical protein